MTTPYTLPEPVLMATVPFYDGRDRLYNDAQMHAAFTAGAASRDAEVEALRADAALSKPKCRECTKWAKEQADNKEWIEAVAKGKEICKVLVSAAIAAEGK